MHSEHERMVFDVPESSIFVPSLFLLYVSDLPAMILEYTLVGYALADVSTSVADVSKPRDRASAVSSLVRNHVHIGEWYNLCAILVYPIKIKILVVSRL